MADQNKIDLEIYKLFVKTISEANHIEEMSTRLTQILVGALGIKGASLFILDPEREELELLSSAGLSMEYVNKGPIFVDKSIKVGPNREPVIIMDTQASDQIQYPEKAKDEGVRSIVSYPITMRKKIIGSLRLYHSEQWEISKEDLDFVEALAQTTGLALMYFRVANAVGSVKEVVSDIHSVWL
jgi:signal transduction protein with GAF and PtsI domain